MTQRQWMRGREGGREGWGDNDYGNRREGSDIRKRGEEKSEGTTKP